MSQFASEEEMLQAMVEVINQGTGLVLDTSHVKELLLEVQREQLKGLVYRAFMAVNKTVEATPEKDEEALGLPPSPTGE